MYLLTVYYIINKIFKNGPQLIAATSNLFMVMYSELTSCWNRRQSRKRHERLQVLESWAKTPQSAGQIQWQAAPVREWTVGVSDRDPSSILPGQEQRQPVPFSGDAWPAEFPSALYICAQVRSHTLSAGMELHRFWRKISTLKVSLASAIAGNSL